MADAPMTASEWVSAGEPAPVTPPVTTQDTTAAPAPVTPAAAPVAGDTTAVTDPVKTQAEVVEEFIEARVGGKPFQLPKNIEIPWKRGAETGFKSFEEFQKEGMMGVDYTRKTMELAAERREGERLKKEMELDRVQMTQQKEYLESEAKRLYAAFENPEEGQRYLDHVKRLQDDPHYRKLHEDAAEGRRIQATSAREQELQQHDQAVSVMDEVRDYIGTTASQYPGVDVQRVVDRYARGLQAREMPLTRSAVDRLFQDEARYLQAGAAPILSEVQSLRAQVEALQAAQHNATVDKAMVSSKRGPTTTTGAAPAPAGRVPPKPFHKDSAEGEDLKRQWARGA